MTLRRKIYFLIAVIVAINVAFILYSWVGSGSGDSGTGSVLTGTK